LIWQVLWESDENGGANYKRFFYFLIFNNYRMSVDEKLHSIVEQMKKMALQMLENKII